MASVVKKPRSPYWYAAFRAFGKQYRKSTRERHKSKALKIARFMEDVAQRKLTVDRVKGEMIDFLRKLYPETAPFVSTRAYFEKWLSLKESTISKATFVSYRKSAAKFLAFIEPDADRDISEVQKYRIAEFRDWCLEKVSARTANLDLQFVRGVLERARRDGYIATNPAEGVDSVREEYQAAQRRPFTLDELRRILALANPEWQSLIRFGLYTGQRLGDLAQLRWEDIDGQKGIISFRAQKTQQTRVLPIAEPLRLHIAELREKFAIEHSCASPSGSVHRFAAVMTTNRLSQQFAKLLVEAGLREPHRTSGRGRDVARQPYALSFHSLRHTANSLLKEAGVPDAVTMAFIGHETDAMSRHYTSVGLDSLRAAASALPRL